MSWTGGLKLVVAITSILLFSGFVTKTTDCSITLEEIEELDMWVHREMWNDMTDVPVYEVICRPSYRWGKIIGRWIPLPDVSKIIYDGQRTDVLVHEIAHGYGANERRAQDVQRKWKNRNKGE